MLGDLSTKSLGDELAEWEVVQSHLATTTKTSRGWGTRRFWFICKEQRQEQPQIN